MINERDKVILDKIRDRISTERRKTYENLCTRDVRIEVLEGKLSKLSFLEDSEIEDEDVENMFRLAEYLIYLIEDLEDILVINKIQKSEKI